MDIEPGKFEEYMKLHGYSNNTMLQFKRREGWFIRNFLTKRDVLIPLTQEVINNYAIWLRDHNNAFNYGFIKAYIDCYDIDGINFRLPKSKSKTKKETKGYKFVKQVEVFKIYNSLMRSNDRNKETVALGCRIMAETGLRIHELQGIRKQIKKGIKEPIWSINLETRHFTGLGKNSKPFKIHFSKSCSDAIFKYLEKYKIFYDRIIDEETKKVGYIPNPNKEIPILCLYRKNGEPNRNQHFAFWNILRKEGEKVLDRHIKPHMFRHHFAHHLRSIGFDLSQIQKALRHSSIVSTSIYTAATEEELENKLEKEVFGE